MKIGKCIRALAERIVAFIDEKSSLESRRRLQKTYAELYVGEDAAARAFEERVKLAERVIKAGILLAGLIIILLIYSARAESLVNSNVITRPADSENVEITLEWQGADSDLSGNMSLIVNGIPPEGASLEDLFAYGEKYLRTLYPDNEPIEGNLDFISKIPKTVISVKWRLEDYTYLLPDGSRTTTEIAAEGVVQPINAELSAYGESFEVQLMPLLMQEKTPEKSFSEKLAEVVKELEAGSIGAYIELPEEMDGVKLSWKEAKSSSIGAALILGLALLAGLFVRDYENRRKLLKEREREMINDYPEIVSKFLLLLEAGLTIHGAWERIVLDYRFCGKKRYAYEEMCITFREMENGISDVTACEGFGKRCRLLPYLRFSNLLVQNLTKGAKSVFALLEQEAINAFEERKELAKKQGEEAGTKLLIPMIGMLVIILIMIMFPAFQNI